MKITKILTIVCCIALTSCSKTSSGTIYNLSNNKGHDYVDLGLPSGTLWATCNIGADTPEDYGDYFAWGETECRNCSKDYRRNYKYCLTTDKLIKYCNDKHCGYNNFSDTLTTLEANDDAATVIWGSIWHIPTEKEWEELIDSSFCTWKRKKGDDGFIITSKLNGNSIFLPAAGEYDYYGFKTTDTGNYWSSILNLDNPYTAKALHFASREYAKRWDKNPNDCMWLSSSSFGTERTNGFPIRPVATSISKNKKGINFMDGHGYVDLGLPSGTLWATSNIGTKSPEEDGLLFSWGETTPIRNRENQNYQREQNYKFGDIDNSWDIEPILTKYCNNTELGKGGFTDSLTVLENIDDAATINWGDNWRMPTIEEWHELKYNCTWDVICKKGKDIFVVTSKTNHNFIFFDTGLYWSSSLTTSTTHSDNALSAESVEILYNCYIEENLRNRCLKIRPVLKRQTK